MLDGFQRRFERHTGKGLADVEGFAVPVEVAVIVSGKGGFPGDLAGKQAGGERHAYDDADILLLSFGEEQLVRALAEDVVDDLHGRNAGIFDRLQRFLDLFD
ncbi:hypothetical protein D9M70_553970 [compost metagenome]